MILFCCSRGNECFCPLVLDTMGVIPDYEFYLILLRGDLKIVHLYHVKF